MGGVGGWGERGRALTLSLLAGTAGADLDRAALVFLLRVGVVSLVAALSLRNSWRLVADGCWLITAWNCAADRRTGLAGVGGRLDGDGRDAGGLQGPRDQGTKGWVFLRGLRGLWCWLGEHALSEHKAWHTGGGRGLGRWCGAEDMEPE